MTPLKSYTTGSDVVDALMSQAPEGLKRALANSSVVPNTNRDRQTALVLSFLQETRRSSSASDIKAVQDYLPIRDTHEAKYGHDDYLGWLSFFPTWLKNKVGGPSRWLPPNPNPTVMPNATSVAIFGDWGSGLYGSRRVAAAIQSLDNKTPLGLNVHLGDVYYAGTLSEVNENVLKRWPTTTNGLNRSLNSNHDMYSGGEGYFESLLKNKLFAGQESSCFCVDTDYVRFIGLDSAIEDSAFVDQQIEWFDCMVGSAGRRALIFLSHHHPISAEGPGEVPAIVAHANKTAVSGVYRFAGWYWGHEHHCVLYSQTTTRPGRWVCAGHGGFPERRRREHLPTDRQNDDGSRWCRVETSDGVALELDGINGDIAGGARYAPHGFISLELDDQKMVEVVRNVDGVELARTTLPTA